MKNKKRYGCIILSVMMILVMVTGCNTIGFQARENSTVDTKIEAIEELIDESYYEEKDVDKDKMTEYAYKGVVSSLGDPYSVYYTKAEYADLNQEWSGEYCGIGVVVTQDVTTKDIKVVKPYENGPGANAGILPDDIIVAVDGVDIKGQDVDKVVAKIKGEKGTEVKITVRRGGKNLDFTMNRDKINVEYVDSQMLEDNIGYIAVDSFAEGTIAQFTGAIDTLEEKKMEGLIIDLRNNPGGDLNAVVSMLQYMLPEGLIVTINYKSGKIDKYTSDGKHEFKKPIVILANGNSASASEVFVGAMRDYGMMTLVGTKTFGKGIVQQFFPFNDGSAVKLTVAKYYTPKGNNIHGTGFEPDVEIQQPEKEAKEINLAKENDSQLKKAIEVMNEKLTDK